MGYVEEDLVSTDFQGDNRYYAYRDILLVVNFLIVYICHDILISFSLECSVMVFSIAGPASSMLMLALL